MRKPTFCICENKDADQLRGNAPVICVSGPLGAGDTGDIAGLKGRDITADESRQCRRCAGVLLSRKNSLHSLISSCFHCLDSILNIHTCQILNFKTAGLCSLACQFEPLLWVDKPKRHLYSRSCSFVH